MPRKPKAKDGLTARERVALYEAAQEQKRVQIMDAADADGHRSDVGDAAEAATKSSDSKPEKILPKPQHATVKVDFSLDVGEIKPMHGMCNGPLSYGADISELFSEIGVPSVRFAGTDTPISAYAVDVSRIFKNASSDPRDPHNYDFACTDRYVMAAYNCGAKVIFRLGESLDRLCIKKLATPNDIDAWCEVCINIIKHYNDYWANGYAFGIERFEIWTSDPNASGEERDAAFELYRKLSGMIKLYDDGLKVGGMCFEDDGEIREFIRYCRKNRAPLDFLTFSVFDSSPLDASAKVRRIIPTLHNLGFNDIEIIVGEWAYITKEVAKSTNIVRTFTSADATYCKLRSDLFAAQLSVKGAAYALSFMMELGSIGEVTAAHLYDAQPVVSPWCAICDRFGERQKTFYAFKMFGDLYRAKNAVYCVSEQTDGYAHSGIYAAATRSSDGSAYVLISSFEGCGVVDLRLDCIPDNVYTAQIYILDGVKSFEEGESVQITGSKKRLLLNISEYGAVLVKLY